MGVLIKLHQQHQKAGPQQTTTNQFQEWQNELDFWNIECNHFLQLMKWENLHISSQPNPLWNQFRLFADEEIIAFTKMLNKCRAEWREYTPSDFQKQYRMLYLHYHQLRIKFRSLKINALSNLIKKSLPLEIY